MRSVAAALLVALWLGAALLTVAVVAPGAFAVLPTRAMAGEMVGRVLPVVFAGAVIVPVLVMVIAPAVRRKALAVASSASAVLASVVALGVVNPRIAALRVIAVVPVDQLAPADPRRVMFGLLHALSVGLLGVSMLALTALLVLLVRAAVAGAQTSRDAR